MVKHAVTKARPLSPDVLHRVAQRLKALADPMRLHILQTLREGELCVGEIVTQVGGSQANVSKHLGVLRSAGLVRARRDGMNVCYSLDDPAVFEICQMVCDALERQATETVAEIEGRKAVGSTV